MTICPYGYHAFNFNPCRGER